jgi:hypothetical protein
LDNRWASDIGACLSVGVARVRPRARNSGSILPSATSISIPVPSTSVFGSIGIVPIGVIPLFLTYLRPTFNSFLILFFLIVFRGLQHNLAAE